MGNIIAVYSRLLSPLFSSGNPNNHPIFSQSMYQAYKLVSVKIQTLAATFEKLKYAVYGWCSDSATAIIRVRQ